MFPCSSSSLTLSSLFLSFFLFLFFKSVHLFRCFFSGPFPYLAKIGSIVPCTATLLGLKPRLFHLTTAFLSYKKHVSIFHLPPLRMHVVDCEMCILVEDAVFMPFIFHPHLPSSTRCFRGYFSSNDLENKWICPISYPFISLKAFHFPYSL